MFLIILSMRTYESVLLPVSANLNIFHLEKLISFIINSKDIFSQNGLLSLSFVQAIVFFCKFCQFTLIQLKTLSKVRFFAQARLRVCHNSFPRGPMGSRNIRKSAKVVTMSLKGVPSPFPPVSASDSLGLQSGPLPPSSRSLGVRSYTPIVSIIHRCFSSEGHQIKLCVVLTSGPPLPSSYKSSFRIREKSERHLENIM